MKQFAPILLLLLSCATAPVAPPDAGALKQFLAACGSDIEKAKRVIIDNDLVKILTHLQAMDNGGKKYYLLERETITALIRSVTEGAYSDFILVNRSGTVVYTMNNNDLFARNVVSGLKNTVLNACYENRKIRPYIGRTSLLPGDRLYTIPFSSSVSGANTMPGIFVLVVDISKIQGIIGSRSFIIDSEGMYAVTRDRSKINSRFPDFDKINDAAPAEETPVRFTDSRGGAGWCQILRYGNLSWIIVTE